MRVDVDRREKLCVGCRGSHRTPKHSHRVIGKRTPSDNEIKLEQISTNVLRITTWLAYLRRRGGQLALLNTTYLQATGLAALAFCAFYFREQ